MKVVHINKKNLEREAAIERMSRDFIAKRQLLVYKKFLKIWAKEDQEKAQKSRS